MDDGAPVFDFIVPDELLAEAVSRSKDPEAIAGLELVPGTGEGKPPPFLGVLREFGYAPLILFGLAAFVPDMIGNGIGILGPNIETSFRLSDAGLGALAFVAAIAQIAWGLPQAVVADRGSRKVVAAVCLAIFAIVMPFMALVKNVWPFAFLYLIAAIGYGTSDTVHNSYLADAYPTHARARVFAWRGLNDPLAQTAGILLVGWVASVDPQLALGPRARSGRPALGRRPDVPARARQGSQRIVPHTARIRIGLVHGGR